jgi:hypothetical protein
MADSIGDDDAPLRIAAAGGTADIDLLPAAPDPTLLSVALGLVRGILQILSGLGFGWALAVTGDQITMIATAGVMLFTLIWSAHQKVAAIRQRRRAVAAATLRAAATAAAVVTEDRIDRSEAAQGRAETRTDAAEASQVRAELRDDVREARERAETRALNRAEIARPRTN